MVVRKPVLYEINTRVWLGELSVEQGRPIGLEDVPGEQIERIASLGADSVWLMGVWRTGDEAVAIARNHPGLDGEYRRALPEFIQDDVVGSPYSIFAYDVDPRLGGPKGLRAFRKALERKGIGLITDFVTNHTGLDHPWTAKRPELYVQGRQEDIEREPWNYFRRKTDRGTTIIAHGKDPYFPGWSDTAQLNFLSRAARDAIMGIIGSIADQCDGIRCDMAMLALEEVFRRIWGERATRTSGPPAGGEFWSEASERVRKDHPGFLLVAEAYWGLETKLLDLGFDFAYDKVLFDRLRYSGAPELKVHLDTPGEIGRRLVRFIENHDEPRAASSFPWDRHRAAALVALTVPGMTLLHEGQLEGRKVKVPVQLRKRPREEPDAAVLDFYTRLLREIRDPAIREGAWRPLSVTPAWDGNWTSQNFLAHEWQGRDGLRLVTVNFAHHRGQCYVATGRSEWRGKKVSFADRLGDASYVREGDELAQKGLFLDLPGYGIHLFAVTAE
jgi:hypothetical protein